MSQHAISTPTEIDMLVGFSDLTLYNRYTQKTGNLDLLALMTAYFELTGGIIEDVGGLFIKTIGDASLAAFRGGDTDAGVNAFLRTKSEGDAWLRAQGLNSVAIVKLHFGAVACGYVGAPSEKRFDIYGKTVNTAALLESKGFAMSPQVFRKLSPETRKLFKKHTPPVTYIAAGERH